MDLYWIDSTLAVASRPRGGDWLDDDLRRVRADGVDVLVSCLESHEEAELGLTSEKVAALEAGLVFERIPIVDRGTPGDLAVFASVAAALEARRRSGERIAVHCRAGLGRSPLVAASLLVRSGLAADDAWAAVATARREVVPETAEQREWIETFVRSEQRSGLVDRSR